MEIFVLKLRYYCISVERLRDVHRYDKLKWLLLLVSPITHSHNFHLELIGERKEEIWKKNFNAVEGVPYFLVYFM